MCNSEIELKIRTLLKKNEDIQVSIENVSSEDDLASIGINSISFIKLAVLIGLEFDFEFDDESLDFSKYKTISNLVSYVDSKIAEHK